MSTTDDPLFGTAQQDDPTGTQAAAATDPAVATATKTVEEQLQEEREARIRAEARADAYKELGVQKQDPATGPAAQTGPTYQLPPLPANVDEMFTPEERKNLETLAVTDPYRASVIRGEKQEILNNLRLQHQAAPLVQGQAKLMVDNFVARSSGMLTQQLAAQVTPLFWGKLAGVDLRPLVGMDANAAEKELKMRWDAARAEVMDKQLLNAPKQDPKLMVPAGGALDTSRKTEKITDDPLIGALAETYKFTPEQLAEIEKA